MGARAGEGLKTINARISSEKERLVQILEKVDETRKKSAEKLIDRAAFMLVTLENMEERIKRDGLITKMQQGGQVIDRAHPLIEKHITMTKNYNATIRQLTDLLPQQTAFDTEAGKRLVNFVTEEKAG